MKKQPSSLELKKIILAAMGTLPAIRQVIMFGSIATGNEHADSDLDLAVDAGRPLTSKEKMELTGQLAISLGRPVDLVDLRTVGEPLLGQILRYGKRLLGSDTDYAKLIARHVFDQADFMPYRNRILAERRRAWIGK